METQLADFQTLAHMLPEVRGGIVDQFRRRADAVALAYRESVQRQVEESQKTYTDLANLLDEIRPKIQDCRKQFAPEFNVFKLLRMERYEVAFHTPMLAELLSPIGSHGQGRLFLESFLIKCCSLTRDESHDPGWYVLAENEYIDLQVANDRLREAIFIENKLDTVAHSGQLSRYFKLWDDKYGQRGCFAYLTIGGDPPPDSGFDNTVGFSNASILTKLKLWSYKRHIAPWLQSLIADIEAPTVKFAVLQYIDVLRRL